MSECVYEYTNDSPSGYIKRVEYFPASYEIRKLIRYYLFFDKYGDEFYGDTDDLSHLEKIEHDGRLLDIAGHDIDTYYNNLDFYGALYNMYWSLWALYTYKKPNNRLDYVRYGLDRHHDFSIHFNNLRLR